MLISLFGSVQASGEKPGVISQSVIFYAQQQKRVFKPSFSNPAFQTQHFKISVLTQPDFENPKKSISDLKKAISGFCKKFLLFEFKYAKQLRIGNKGKKS